MAIIAVSIVKRVSFRGAQQEFSNVYHYNIASVPNAAGAATLMNNVKAVEVPLHSTDVTFVRASAWTAGGSSTSNNMINEITLSGTGSQATNTSMDRERALLFQWPAGVNNRGRPVFLRKWIHCCGNASGIAFNTTILQNTTQIQPTDQTTLANQMALNTGQTTGTDPANLCGPTGRATTGGVKCYPWLEHHQLGDAWR